MPNWCSNSIAITGSKRELGVLYDRMRAAQASSTVTQNWWTFELFVQHFYNKEEILEPFFPYVGGSLDDIKAPEKCGDEYVIFLWITTRWSHMIDGFRKILSQYLTTKLYYVAEESGEALYINTDVKHRFFSDMYVIYDDDNGSEYFNSDVSFLNFMKQTYDKDIPLISDLKDDDEIDVGNGKSISFHRFVSY